MSTDSSDWLGRSCDDDIVDPDIAGPGVVTAFCASSCMCYFLAVAAYFTGTHHPEMLGVFDMKVLGRKSKPRTNPRLRCAVEHGLLLFGDQQVITGIAILLTGYIRLGLSPAINNIDWYGMQCLGWFSAVTHLVTLSVLKIEFRLDVFQRSWRLIGLGIMFLLLQLSFITNYGPGWPGSLLVSETPMDPEPQYWTAAIDSIKDAQEQGFLNLHDDTSADALLTNCWLTVVFAWKALLLFAPWNRPHWLRMQKRLEGWIRRRAIRCTSDRSRLRFRIPTVISIYILSIRDFFSSFAFTLIILIGTLLWGLTKIIRLRQVAQYYSQSCNGVDWGFGQIIALCQLALPVLGILGAIFAKGYIQPSTIEYKSPQVAQMGCSSSHHIVDSEISAASILPLNGSPLLESASRCTAADQNGSLFERALSLEPGDSPFLRADHIDRESCLQSPSPRIIRPFYDCLCSQWSYRVFGWLHIVTGLFLIINLGMWLAFYNSISEAWKEFASTFSGTKYSPVYGLALEPGALLIALFDPRLGLRAVEPNRQDTEAAVEAVTEIDLIPSSTSCLDTSESPDKLHLPRNGGFR